MSYGAEGNDWEVDGEYQNSMALEDSETEF